ncbi:hypothetical protein BGZ54_004858 [Gamsiella multidivaricata]|nr:hypothetical protein BGZ54_004858 [Gamsiella multidivaricata]
MSLYITAKGSPYNRSHYLNQSLHHLAEQYGMTLFSVKDVNLSCSQTVFNPDGNPIADILEITMRASTIGSKTVDLQFFYDPYDWSFPPDLIIHGLSTNPSLSDLGLDDSWDHEDPANLSRVLGKLSRMMQHGERQRVALCDNERIQVEYSCLHDMEEMDCCLIPGMDGPTKVLFAVPFHIAYHSNGKKRRTKVVAKIQFLISSLVPNDITAAQSKLEVLSSFEYPELIQSVSEISKEEPITAYIERVTKRVTDHFERQGRSRQLKKEFIETITTTFKPFPDEYPKMTMTAPVMPGDSYTATPPPEAIPIKRYSPRWGADRIVTEIWEQLWDDIPRFHTKLLHMASSQTTLV